MAIFKENFFYITAQTVKEWFVFSKPAVMNYLGGLKIIKWDNGFMIMHGKIIMFGYNSGPLRPCLKVWLISTLYLHNFKSLLLSPLRSEIITDYWHLDDFQIDFPYDSPKE